MWWESVVKSYIVLGVIGTVGFAVPVLWHTIKDGTTPLAEVFLPLAVLFWVGCWRAFLFHRWSLVALCVVGWLLALLLSAHTDPWDRPKHQDPTTLTLYLLYWIPILLFTNAIIKGWSHWNAGF